MRSARLRKILVGAQIALSFLLLVGAGLFSRTLTHLKHTDTGIRSIESLIAFSVNPAKSGYTVPQLRRFYGDLLDRIRATPDVESAAYTWIPLLQGWAPGWHMRVEGYSASDGENMEIQNNIVSPGYWQTMGVRLARGAGLRRARSLRSGGRGGRSRPSRSSIDGSPSDSSVREAPSADASVSANTPDALGIRIVGVVEDSLYAGPRTGLPAVGVFLVYTGEFSRSRQPSTFARARNRVALFPALRRVVAGLDRSMPIYGMKTVERQLDDTLSSERLIASLSAVFAALATTMAALGLYGVMSFVVARRTREIGLRIALGAASSTVVRMVMGEIAILAGSGLLVGLPCAYGLSRLASSQLLDMPAGGRRHCGRGGSGSRDGCRDLGLRSGTSSVCDRTAQSAAARVAGEAPSTCSCRRARSLFTPLQHTTRGTMAWRTRRSATVE